MLPKFELDLISATFLKDCAPVIAIHLNHISLLIKLDTLFDTLILEPLLKKGNKTEAKNFIPVSLLLSISNLIEKSIRHQT